MSTKSNMLREVEDTEKMTEEQQKEHYVVNYLKSLIAIEHAIEPYKEQKKDLRKEYMENGWLTRGEIWATVKAYRLYERDADIDDLNDMFEIVEKQFGSKNV
jgi:hypothetical protein